MTLYDIGTPARLRPVHRPIPFPTLRVVAALILREMATTYGRKPGGFVWAILEPVGAIMILSWIFSLGFRNPALGTSFAMFYATGFLPFSAFVQTAQKVGQSLQFSRALLSYPRVTVLDALIARFILTVLVQTLVATIILLSLRAIIETGTTLVLPRVLLGFGLAAALGAGFGAFNCVLLTAFPLYQTAWRMVSRPLVFFSGVIFMLESLPRPLRDYLEWNPVAHAVAEVRAGFYFGYHPDYVDPTYVLLVAGVALATGIAVTWRFHRMVTDR